MDLRNVGPEATKDKIEVHVWIPKSQCSVVVLLHYYASFVRIALFLASRHSGGLLARAECLKR